MESVKLEPALCVDMDGTLIRTDSLHEHLLLLLKTRPLELFSTGLALSRGIAAFKREVCSRVSFQPESLPYNEAIIAYIREQASQGRRILLVTAADQVVANRVAEHIGVFETVLASDGVINLKSEAKAAAIRKYLNDWPFEYIGDSFADLPIWKQSSGAIAVNSTGLLRRIINNYGVPVTKEFPGGRVSFFTLLKAIRVYQWSKNLLVFAPLFLSHTILQIDKTLSAAETFMALCAAASTVYVINDLFDLEADRRHQRKRSRPFASGALTVRQGALIIIFLLSLTILISSLLPARAQLFIVAYILISALYSIALKSKLFIDITTLAGLYTLRVLCGGAAADVPISPWTLAFSIFLFISLAICKRLTELHSFSDRHDGIDGAVPGRAYSQSDWQTIVSLGSSSGYVAVLVLALYLNSPDVTALYARPRALWLICPLLVYWISRMLIIANRGQMHDDPIVFTFRDRASWIVATAILAVAIVSL